MKHSKVLITGGAGFIGSVVVQAGECLEEEDIERFEDSYRR